jgi:hypothetical protein
MLAIFNYQFYKRLQSTRVFGPSHKFFCTRTGPRTGYMQGILNAVNSLIFFNAVSSLILAMYVSLSNAFQGNLISQIHMHISYIV